MRKRFQSMWNEEDGMLTFEWVMLSALLTLGVVTGVAGVRDAIVDELGDLTEAMVSLDQSYTIDVPIMISARPGSRTTASGSQFTDRSRYDDYARMKLVEEEEEARERKAEASDAAEL